MEALDPYLESKVTTAAPYELHLLVIDGAISSARRAVKALEEQDYETAHLSLNRSREFVTELIGGLNPDPASELVTGLKDMFAYVYGNLVRADIDHDAARARDAIRILEMHRDTWRQLIQQLQMERTRLVSPHADGRSGDDLCSDSAHNPRSWTA